MRSTVLMAQSATLKTQNLLDDLMVLKGSLMTSKEKQELIDIVSNGIFFLENLKSDLVLVEKNITQPKQRRLTE